MATDGECCWEGGCFWIAGAVADGGAGLGSDWGERWGLFILILDYRPKRFPRNLHLALSLSLQVANGGHLQQPISESLALCIIVFNATEISRIIVLEQL